MSLEMQRHKQLNSENYQSRMDFQSRGRTVAIGNSNNKRNAGRHEATDSWKSVYGNLLKCPIRKLKSWKIGSNLPCSVHFSSSSRLVYERSFFHKNGWGVAAGVDNAKNSYLSGLHAVEDQIVIDRKGVDVGAQARLENLADIGKLGKESKLVCH
jgi:hypothetical protein